MVPSPLIAQAFLDDSGSPGTFLWAGYLGSASVWAKFQQRWVDILQRPPAIDYWHTASARNGRIPQLSRMQREEKELRLAELIGSFREWIVSLEVRMSLEDHARIVKGHLKIPPSIKKLHAIHGAIMETPHYMALRDVVCAVVGITGQWAATTAAGLGLTWIVFEDADQEWQDDVCLSMSALRKVLSQEQRARLGPVVFLPGKGRGGAPALEAADLFAWHRNRQMTKVDEDPPPAWEHLRKVTPNVVEITPEKLKRFVSTFNS